MMMKIDNPSADDPLKGWHNTDNDHDDDEHKFCCMVTSGKVLQHLWWWWWWDLRWKQKGGHNDDNDDDEVVQLPQVQQWFDWVGVGQKAPVWSYAVSCIAPHGRVFIIITMIMMTIMMTVMIFIVILIQKHWSVKKMKMIRINCFFSNAIDGLAHPVGQGFITMVDHW